MKSPFQRLRSSGSRRASEPSRLPWLAGAVLVLLLVLLALLQLRWLGEVAQADRQRLDAGVHAALQGVRLDFDREISRAWLAFRQPSDRPSSSRRVSSPPSPGEPPFTPDDVVDLWRRWRETAPAPGLVGGLWLVTEDGRARRWDGRSWAAAESPFSAGQQAIVERDLTWDRRWGRGRGGDGSPPRERSPGGLPFLHAELPGLVVPVAPLAPEVARVDTAGAGAPDGAGADGIRRGVVVLFDQGFLTGELLPSLADRYLEPVLGDGASLRVVVRREDGTGGAVLAPAEPAERSDRSDRERGPANDEAAGPERADASFPWQVPVFGLLPPDDLLRLGLTTGALAEELPAGGERGDAPSGRVETVSGTVSGTASGTASGMASGSRSVAEPDTGPAPEAEAGRRERRMAALASILGGPPGWLLEVRPAGGTLHAALARARWGNAAVSFGILLLLALAAGALALSARRAQETARRQLELTASISHELRTPLAAIRSLAENLADGVVREGAQARRYGEEINRQGERLSEMVEQVLALSALTASQGGRPRTLRPIDPAALVAEAVAESRAVVPDARVEVDLPAAEDSTGGNGGLPTIQGDPTALRRALQNLVANALKHGGDPPWAAVRVCVERGEGTLRIGVTDRGPGIPAAERERIFEPFVRGQRAQDEQLPGAGLGLHLVRRTAESHGGRVEVWSSPGEGSTFTLVLPLRPDQETP